MQPDTQKPDDYGRGRKLRFYLASSFALRDRVQGVCEQLESLGHFVPVQWWDHSAESHQMKANAYITDDQFYASRSVQTTAARDFGGVTVADVVILVTDPEKPIKFNGAMIELGYGLALGKKCFALGQIERSAMFAHVGRAERLEEILEALGLPTAPLLEARP
jgi:nucleoside 2-deoxyribosyltransferase